MSGSAAPPAPAPGGPSFALQVASGLHGAFLLARGRVEGFAFASLSPEGPARSLFALALCAPAYLALRLMAWGEGGGAPGGADPGVAIVSDLAGYAAAWGAYGLASGFVAGAWGRGALWPRYLAAWAWCSVPQHAAYLLGALLPGAAGDVAALLALGWAVWLAWFVARAGLRLDGARAAGLVAVEVAVALFAAEVATAVARP